MKLHHTRRFYHREINSKPRHHYIKYPYFNQMPYGQRCNFEFADKYHPSPFIPKTKFVKEETNHDSDLWACDYCEVATFESYEEACAHERSCLMNQTILSTNKSSHLVVNKTDDSMQLAMPEDIESLSDRQCYVRSHFVEIFKADETHVAARHSKGAQKLYVGQVGIRCKHCSKFPVKNRCERAVCFPSSINRIYQTVADMQRFHFEACNSIPSDMKVYYQRLKTTRPRGVGSPQDYWVSSALALGLVDTDQGIRFACDKSKRMSVCASQNTNNSDFSITERESPPYQVSKSSSLPPLSPESQSTANSPIPSQTDSSECELLDRDSEANMLLALRNTNTALPF